MEVEYLSAQEDSYPGADAIDDWDDPMFSLPNEFLTSFNISQLARYRKAVETWPQGKDFQVTDRDSNGRENCGQGSLWYYGPRGEELGPLGLTPFWDHFETIKE